MISTLVASLVLFQPALAPGDHEKDWRDVRTAIERRYYARTKQKDRMTSLLDKHEPIAKAAATRDEFASAVNKMIDEFGDSHFDFFTPLDQGYYVMDNLVSGSSADKMPHVNIWFAPPENGKHRVQMVMTGSEADKAGVRKGDWVSLEKGPVGTFMDRESVELKFERNGKATPVKLNVIKEPPMKMFLDATKRSVQVMKVGDKSYGYVRVWTMGSRDFREALQDAVKGPLADTDGIILDLRDGFGGSPRGYLDIFFTPKSEGKGGYTKPMVALINEGTRSAKEISSLQLKKTGRAPLVGRNTAGHVLGTSPMRLNEWSYLEIPMIEVPVEGENLEKKGVAPDVEVPVEFSAEGEDLILKRGLYEIQKLTATKL